MATITSAQAGDWSSTSTWTGGVKPGSGDTAVAAHAVTIDENITGVTLQNTTGGFVASVGGITITSPAGTLGATSASPLLTCSPASGTLSVVMTDLSVGAYTGALATGAVVVSGGAGTTNLDFGTLAPDTSTTGSEPSGVYVAGPVGVFSIGSMNAGAGVGVTVVDGGTITTLNGNPTGGSNNSTYGLYQTGGTITTLNGNPTGGSGSGSYGLYQTGGTITTFTGNPTGGSGTGSYGLYQTGGTITTFTGNPTGGSSSNAYGAYLSANTGTTVRGEIRHGSGNSAVGLFIGNTAVVRLSGTAYCRGAEGETTGTIGPFPISGPFYLIEGEEFEVKCMDDGGWPTPATGGTVRTLSRYGENLPEMADVREGVLYGAGDTNEGTLAVPAPESVAYGVPVDDTVGTAALDGETLSNVLKWHTNKRTVTDSEQVLYDDDGTTPLYTQTLTDDGTTSTREPD